jgi:uncharacterized protein (TIGR03435 family)
VKKLIFWLLAFSSGPGSALFAQNLAGSWQGSLQPPQARAPLRVVLKISRADDESLKAVFYSIDQGGQSFNASSATQQGSTFKMAISAIGANYEAKLNPDGASMAGNWSQGGGQSVPLNLVRTTPETAWAIPEPPPPPKLMPADATPTFDVATIKPSKPDAQGTSILVGRGGTNLFTTTNTTLADLITFAYGLHARQLTGGPAWIESERYDITAKPDQAGMPNVTQLRSMVQKLLAERFQLTFHRDTKELSAYVLTVAKSGSKLAKSDANAGSLPGFGGRGPGNLGVRNSTTAEFAGFLQSRIVERPVVDQTGLPDRYDFTLRWTPDRAPTAAPGADAPPAAANVDAPPDLFAAFQQQLGLKLEAGKAPVEVLVIDKVQKPSEN